MNIGQKLKEYRNALGISGQELGKISGTGQSTISEIESGKRSPSIETLEKICLALNIKLIDLLSDEDPLEPELLQLLNSAKKLTPVEQKAVAEMLNTLKG
ncbi:MAG TPA: helix-turn-helix transcriptional regulator [Bacillales bacterium]|nr:helix-turn-helix transcriptional regulator [Bacillales bacterium]